MAHIHYVECNTTHTSNFVIDVPVGYHWLLVITKTPAQFWVDGELKEFPAHSAILYRPSQKVYYRACTDHFVNDWIRFEADEPYITESPLPLGVPFALGDPDYCHKLFELLVIEHNFNRDCRESSIDYLLRTLFNKLWESYFQNDITPQYYKLLKLRTAIQTNPGDYWTVSKMADFLRISPGYLQNIYKKTFRSGDPNGQDSTGEELPRWEPYAPEAPYGMLFGDQAEFSREQPNEIMKFLVQQYFKKDR